MKPPNLHINVVLFQPAIPWNTGSVGRTCLGFGGSLHLVGPMKFKVDDKQAKRAGLDYWHSVDLHQYRNWDHFLPVLPSLGKPYFFTPQGNIDLLQCEFEFRKRKTDDKDVITLLFGNENYGFEEIEHLIQNESRVRVPMVSSSIRSFNLANTASLVIWEAFRQYHR
eukprot:TRINITY_DN2838_c0_g2_i2.p1 TRINITY_DN2838_c0_g2~~TRINITY_DN2838_c0_g2_i2.p1  ORF type:complete len:167 (-),score=8.19 TRINITY_DN2838_c0_g2_i2:407-907(-)